MRKWILFLLLAPMVFGIGLNASSAQARYGRKAHEKEVRHERKVQRKAYKRQWKAKRKVWRSENKRRTYRRSNYRPTTPSRYNRYQKRRYYRRYR